MPSIVIEVDEIENKVAEAIPGFSGEASITVPHIDTEEFELGDVEIKVWRNGSFRMQPASDPVAEAIRKEIERREDTLDRIVREISADIADRREYNPRRYVSAYKGL